MCGIVAAGADRNIVGILPEGLNTLEYRRYDAAGRAVLNPGPGRLRSVGRVAVAVCSCRMRIRRSSRAGSAICSRP